MPPTSTDNRPAESSPSAEADLEALPLERLETEITTLAGQISAATCRLLEAIAAYDRREGWGTWGCRSMTHWLTWRTAMSPSTAREHLRVAHALAELPRVRELFSEGRLSYSQVRALTRIAVPATEADLVGLARSMTAGQLDRLAAAYRGVKAATTDTARRRWSRRSVVSYLDSDGMRVIVVREPPEEGERILRALDAVSGATWRARRHAADAQPPGGDPDESDSVEARRADALVTLVGSAAEAINRSGAAEQTLLVVHTSPEVLAGGDPDGPCHVEDGPALAPETARRLGCDAASVTVTEGPDGYIDVGRRSRRVPAALRRALDLRDPTCVFPGCEATMGTEAHHVQHWSAGGPTTLANLARLCPFHHHRLHEGGFAMRPRIGGVQAGGTWEFLRPDGMVILALPHGRRRHDGLPAACDEIEPDACVPDWDGSRLDAGWIVEGLLECEGLIGTKGGGERSASAASVAEDDEPCTASRGGERVQPGDLERGYPDAVDAWPGGWPSGWPAAWADPHRGVCDTAGYHLDDGWRDGAGT